MEDRPPNQQHVCRIGISRGDNAVGKLGETLPSFGYGGTAKFSNAGIFSDYSETFGVGDTIVCAVDLQYGSLASIKFSKNGKWVGYSKQYDAGLTGTEMMMVVGIPASGESTWAERWVREHLVSANSVGWTSRKFSSISISSFIYSTSLFDKLWLPSHPRSCLLSQTTLLEVLKAQASDLHARGALIYAHPSYGTLHEIIQYLQPIYPSASQYFQSVHPSVFQHLWTMNSSRPLLSLVHVLLSGQISSVLVSLIFSIINT